jgi:hypothetical protein
MSVRVLMLQLSLRDNVPLGIPFRGLKPTATIKSRSATKCNGLDLQLFSNSVSAPQRDWRYGIK